MSSFINHLHEVSAARNALEDLKENYAKALAQGNLPKIAFYHLMTKAYARAGLSSKHRTEEGNWEFFPPEAKLDLYGLAEVLNATTAMSGDPESSYERFGKLVFRDPPARPILELSTEDRMKLSQILHAAALHADIIYGFTVAIDPVSSESGELLDETVTITW